MRLIIFYLSDFWGPASNFGIPLAAVMDIQKDPEMCVSSFLIIPAFTPPPPQGDDSHLMA
jgi:hypothetical protein